MFCNNYCMAYFYKKKGCFKAGMACKKKPNLTGGPALYK